jgi:hypothetical protein
MLLGKNSLVKKEVRRSVVVVQQPVPLSTKFGAKSSHIFTQPPQNVTVVCGIHCFPERTNSLRTIPLMSI